MSRPSVLVVAGLDPSGGAGLVADVRVCEQLGCRPVGVATALTEQSTIDVRAVNPVPADVLGDQLRTLLTDIEVVAVKLGMLGSQAVADEVARALELTAAPVVWDPVLRPTRGNVFLFEGDPAGAVAAFAGLITLCTPNADEVAALTGRSIATIADAVAAGRELGERGLGAVRVKGGHWGAADHVVDVLVSGDAHVELAGPRVAVDVPVHGTGCALSTAIACHLALGRSLEDACRAARAYVADRVAAPVAAGRGRPSVL
jgi:hydroxymethylpyrimidine/phosphomethylpyrimidine kinase